ncbi:serine acetyltransferase [Pantoea endophytica]
MKDFKIEYRDGKLLECRVDGVLVECLSSLHLIHEGRELPTLTITTHVSSKETLTTPNPDRKKLESVIKGE